MASREKFLKVLRSLSYRRQVAFWNVAQQAADMWEELTTEQQQAVVNESPLAAIWKAGYEKGRERTITDAGNTMVNLFESSSSTVDLLSVKL